MSLAARLDHLQSREDDARLWLLRAAGKIGESMGMPVHAVGGFVRDLLLGRVAARHRPGRGGRWDRLRPAALRGDRWRADRARGIRDGVDRGRGDRGGRGVAARGRGLVPPGALCAAGSPAAREPGRPGRRSHAAGLHDQRDGAGPGAVGLRPSGGPLRRTPRFAPARPAPPSSLVVRGRPDAPLPGGALRRAPRRPLRTRRSGGARAGPPRSATFPRCPASGSARRSISWRRSRRRAAPSIECSGGSSCACGIGASGWPKACGRTSGRSGASRRVRAPGARRSTGATSRCSRCSPASRPGWSARVSIGWRSPASLGAPWRWRWRGAASAARLARTTRPSAIADLLDHLPATVLAGAWLLGACGDSPSHRVVPSGRARRAADPVRGRPDRLRRPARSRGRAVSLAPSPPAARRRREDRA